jgi:hypothetical protein
MSTIEILVVVTVAAFVTALTLVVVALAVSLIAQRFK